MTSLFMRAFGDLPSAAEATITIGDYRRLLPIGILQWLGCHWSPLVRIGTDSHQCWSPVGEVRTHAISVYAHL